MAQPFQLVATLPGMMETVLRAADNAFIPFDEANREYQEYLAWLADGNTPDPPPPPSRAGVIAQSAQSLQLADAKSLAAQGRTDEAVTALINIIEAQTT
jgi:hypothetical protein